MLERVLRLLEFDKIKSHLKQYASSSLGQDRVEQHEPSNDFQTVNRLLEETDEGAKIIRLKGHMPLGGVTDIRPHLKRATIGATLNARELNEIASLIRALRIAQKFLRVFSEEEADIPLMYGAIKDMEPEALLERKINSCIDDNGTVMDDASSQLRSVRTTIKTLESRIKGQLDGIVRSSTYRKVLSEAIVTIRNDRYVVPVKAESKGSVKGIVHDQSASGATLFIEPQSVVDLNNRLNEARVKEENEIQKILSELTAETTAVVPSLEEHVAVLSYIDFIYARARYAAAKKAIKPAINQSGHVDIKKARHPLISDDDVVPIDIVMDDGVKAMIITGPNTGGKTVTLKTMGLLTLMAQAGMHIPAQEGSTVNIFRDVYADIGDEQSIEQSLSTFSSHMTNIVDILKDFDNRSLVLFDELGAGTDPQEGAALSVAILDAVLAKDATVIATTHYSELKAFAYEREQVINASVEFDVETLRPTYRLLIGVPGRSNAFDISRRLGLDTSIIDYAKGQIGSDTTKVDDMIAALEADRKAAEKARQSAESRQAEVTAEAKRLKDEHHRLDREKEQIIQRAKDKAKTTVEKAKNEADEIIKDLRNKYRDATNVKEHELIDAKSRMDQAMDVLQTNEEGQTDNSSTTNEGKNAVITFNPGDDVKVKSLDQKGQILERINKNEFLVQIGILKMNIKANDLKSIKPEKTAQPVVNVRTPGQTVKPELDLRGQRYEEAMISLDKYLDAALLAGYPRVSIIHGKGTGALRNGVQKKIDQHSRIKTSRFGGMGEGGSGVTIVEFK